MATATPQVNSDNTTPAPTSLETALKTAASESATSGTEDVSSAPWTTSGSSNYFKNPSNMDVTDNGSFLWCFIDAFANDQKTTLARLMTTKTPPTKGNSLVSFQFLMEDKCDLSLSHTWDKATDIVSNAANKLVDFANESKVVQGLIKAPQTLENIKGATGNLQNTSAKLTDPNSAATTLASLTSSTGAELRMDEAKLFKETTRQKITLNFTLGVWKSSNGSKYSEKLYNEIVLPVKSLLWCSCATASGLFSIKYPSIFSVKIKSTTSSNSLLEMKYAILTDVQPTYKGPWVDGMPMTCDLSLTFENLLPTYKQSFQEGGWGGSD